MQLLNSRPLLASTTVAFQSLLNGIEQILIAERLGQKLHSSCFHRLHAHWDVTMPSDENDRNHNVCLGHALLQIEAAEPFESHIEQQTARHVRTLAAQELLGRCEDLHSQPH